MDKFVSFFAFPIGLFLCFTPVLLVWLKEERRYKEEQRKDVRRK